MNWMLTIKVIAASVIASGLLCTQSANAQFGVNTEKQLRTTFGYQPKTNFEPTLRTNYEPTIRASFGFKSNTSATNTILSQRLSLLQARLPEEKKYIEEVISYVDQQKLSLALVNDAFFYSIKRYRGPLAFSYFEQILKIKAARLKQEVPEFDRSIYSRPAFKPQTFNQ